MIHLLGHRLAHIVNLKRRLMDSRLQNTTITRSQRQILLMLHQCGDCTQKTLLGQLDMDPAQLARTLDGLEKDGLVRRSPWAANRRCMFVEMTEHCRAELMPALLAAVDSVDRRLFQGFSADELQQTQRLLDRMQANMQMQDEGSPR
ncbi:MarR family winged helix-turn-helix transcriptional regulator [Chromobacterium sp. CV08]|uniref:MarR family winged helix-turn-helix transcriptional regulator n=1 Tax=Chromobacterium sp. CV08 TaxID=3133274 RepID=UPI003DAA064B